MSAPLVTVSLVSSDLFRGGFYQCGGYSHLISVLLGPALDTGPVLASLVIAVILIGLGKKELRNPKWNNVRVMKLFRNKMV